MALPYTEPFGGVDHGRKDGGAGLLSQTGPAVLPQSLDRYFAND